MQEFQNQNMQDEVVDTDDGGAILSFDNPIMTQARSALHYENLVFSYSESELKSIAIDLVEKIENDREARKRRDELYEEGLRRTGLGDDAPGGAQFTGATRVVHPLLTEVCVDFAARAIKELFPPNGPVRTKLIGEPSAALLDKADRKVQFMNWQCTEQIVELRSEIEQLLTQLPLGGAQYLKLYWNTRKRRPEALFVPVDDLYLPFAASSFLTAERKTHVQYVTEKLYDVRVQDGTYADVGNAGEVVDYSAASIANDRIEGREGGDDPYNNDGLRTIYEIYTELEFEDESGPYIITIDKSTEQVLSLYRNWDPSDELKKELQWIVEFPFVPWRGAYPIGITHMIGGIAGATTGALRALLDSAHLSNIPTLLKLKGGPSGQLLNPQPTEVIEIEGGVVQDDVRKIAMPLPFNGPSAVLLQLLGFLVEAGKGVVQTTFEHLNSQDPNQPVGTTLALIEQGMVVFSAIHARLHASMARFLDVLHRLNSSYLTDEIILKQFGRPFVQVADFQGPIDVLPKSDPTIFSETQRFAQLQAVMQRATAMPQLYNVRKVEELFLKQIGLIEAKAVLVEDITPKDVDPIQENSMCSMGRPIAPVPQQDHMSHLQVHIAFLFSPVFGMNKNFMQIGGKNMVKHVYDHMTFAYMTQASQQVQQAMQQQQDPTQTVVQVQQQLEQQFDPIVKKLAEISQVVEQNAPEVPQNPMEAQIALAKLQIESQKIQNSALQQEAQTKIALNENSVQSKVQDSQLKMQSRQIENQIKIQEAKTKLAALERQAQIDSDRENAQLEIEKLRQDNENRRTQYEVEMKHVMNQEDNATAIKLAEMEIENNDKVAVSSGTGLNPSP